MAVIVTADEFSRAKAAADELWNPSTSAGTLIDGATDTVNNMPGALGAIGLNKVAQPLLDQYQAIALAIIRLTSTGNPKFPTALPSYVVASMPPASGYTGCMIYVSNAAGGPIPAFSDGVTWRRVDTRAVVT